jgi:hypothetical protein
MCRVGLAVLGVAVALLVGCSGGDQTADAVAAASLQGAWEITSVQRDGELDSLQVGARMTFTGNEVNFQPKVVQIDDGTG